VIIVKDGIYEHYKGARYVVLHVGRDSNNHANRETVVIYMSLSPPYAGAINTRWASEFLEWVTVPGRGHVPRFKFCRANTERVRPKMNDTWLPR
jgi:hypothetical protein